ncbi:MAG: hypothetical protein K0B37_14075 [Bacteroidales bacterium]|nr:hypothetical protein [Bacteroidales bacterium]
MKKKILSGIVLILSVISGFVAAQEKPFVPIEFIPPVSFENEYFHIRTLSRNNVYAVENLRMNAYDHLPERVPHMGAWHRIDIPMGDDLIGQAYYDRNPQIRDSFVYPVLLKSEGNMIGSIYIRPSKNADYDAQITMWLRTSDNQVNDEFVEMIKLWISKEWPFENPHFAMQSIKVAK